MSTQCASLDISVFKLPEEQEGFLRTRAFREYLDGCFFINILCILLKTSAWEGKMF